MNLFKEIIQLAALDALIQKNTKRKMFSSRSKNPCMDRQSKMELGRKKEN
jgi:hypothetical protein